MKLSDYIVEFVENYVDSAFLLSGGGIMHIVDSLGRAKKLKTYCMHHEQAAAIAAEGYGRMTNKAGVVFVTTGPGGTNAITGAAGAWLDSIPMLVINGQVKTDNITPRKNNGGQMVRATGFQELNVIDMVKPMSKYAETVEHPEDIRYHLEKAVYLATHGRPGPSWVEIPLDIQTAEVDPKNLRGYFPAFFSQTTSNKIPMKTIVDMLKNAKRPMLLVGNGIRLGGGEEILWKVLKKLNINTATTIFTCDDLVTYEYPQYLGRQGVPGSKPANWAIDNCDVLLVVGERMQLTQTSYDYENFATQAKVIMVDIDENELHKKMINTDVAVHADAKTFLEELYNQDLTLNRWDIDVPAIDPSRYTPKKGYVNIYAFLEELSKHLDGHHVTTADGMASVGPHQALRVKRGQRFLTNAGLGHMGSGLPYAIGACIASGKQPVVCMEGDGSLMLNIQELQTVLHHKLPIKLYIWNNNGYFSIRTTHTNYFKKVFAADPASGVSFPNFEKLTKAWGFDYVKIASDADLHKVEKVQKHKGPIVCELFIDPAQPMLAKWSAGKLRGK
ncbi:thiamine pyrophosphate-binding protein [Candidatus Woesebacteria bacterium]|nr:thiamine pyrophosphate-binding protein [Candidatus Woesebacteria bacterium]